jgi:hypothetical protein
MRFSSAAHKSRREKTQQSRDLQSLRHGFAVPPPFTQGRPEQLLAWKKDS